MSYISLRNTSNGSTLLGSTPVSGGASYAVSSAVNPSSSSGTVKVSLPLNNAQAVTGGGINGPASPAAWSFNYTAIGGNALFQVTLQSFSSAATTREFNLRQGSTIIGTCVFCFNAVNTHTSISFAAYASLSPGTATYSISIPSGVNVDFNDRAFVSITEVK
jgi:hypothetical protein